MDLISDWVFVLIFCVCLIGIQIHADLGGKLESEFKMVVA